MVDEQLIYLLDGKTGKMLTRYKADENVYAPMVVDGGIIYQNRRFDIDGNSIKKSWEVKINGQYIVGSVIKDNDRIIFLDNKNNLYIVDIQSGEARIEKKIDTVKKPSEVFFNNGKLYIFGKNVELDCFEV